MVQVSRGILVYKVSRTVVYKMEKEYSCSSILLSHWRPSIYWCLWFSCMNIMLHSKQLSLGTEIGSYIYYIYKLLLQISHYWLRIFLSISDALLPLVVSLEGVDMVKDPLYTSPYPDILLLVCESTSPLLIPFSHIYFLQLISY